MRLGWVAKNGMINKWGNSRVFVLNFLNESFQ